MSQPLGKVTGDLDAERGPDVTFRVTVDRAWFGRTVSVTPSRNVNCAQCEGGGCDRCDRAGAVSLWERGQEPRCVTLTLPDLPDSSMDVCLRVPEQGGAPLVTSDVEDAPLVGRGHLMLLIRPGEASDPQVELVAAPGMSDEERTILVKRSLIMAGALVLLFVGLLHLSGWL